jgi:hypothetical protein
MAQKQQPPFPIVLDLSDNDTYSVLTLALGQYAETARGNAADEAEKEKPNQHPPASFRIGASATSAWL